MKRVALQPSTGEMHATIARDSGDVEATVIYAYEPAVRATRDDPGAAASIEIVSVIDVDGAPIALSDRERDQLVEACVFCAENDQFYAFENACRLERSDL